MTVRFYLVDRNGHCDYTTICAVYDHGAKKNFDMNRVLHNPDGSAYHYTYTDLKRREALEILSRYELSEAIDWVLR